MQGVEPATGLVNAFCYKVGGECLTFINQFFVLKWVMPLGIRHGAAIEPDIYQV